MSTKTKNHCGECGALLRDPGEFHPYVFCVLKKAGRDPWPPRNRVHGWYRRLFRRPVMRRLDPNGGTHE